MTPTEAKENQATKDWRITIERGVVLIRFAQGAIIDADLLKSAYNQLAADPEKYRNVNAVWDFRKVIAGQRLGYAEISEVVEHFQSLRQGFWQHRKSAVVVGNKVSYGLCRMYGALMDGKLDFELNIFENDLDAAIAWAAAAN